MAMVNNFANAKDSRWLQLEVCREYQRNKCTRSDTECKFAHPPATVEVQNGRVIACYDSIKGRCNREKPPCKYFHPPPHLKDQLLINGRNHLALKNALMQQVPLQPVLAGQIPAVVSGAGGHNSGAGSHGGGGPQASPSYSHIHAGLVYTHLIQQQQHAAAAAAQQRAMAAFFINGHANHHHHAAALQASNNANLQANAQAQSSLAAAFSASLSPPLANKATTNPYLTSLPAMGTATSFPYLTHSPMMAAAAAAAGLMPADAMAAAQLSVVPAATLVTPQKIPRTDRLEVCREFQRGNCKRAETECRFAHPPEHLAVDSAEGVVTVCMDFVKGRCSRDPCRYFHPPPHLQAQLKAAQSRANAAAMAFPGMSPYTKRPALDKSGVPVYQPGTAAYQQALAMQVQQPFVPVSSTTSAALSNAASIQYCDDKGQLLDTLQVCRDFKSGQCKRPQCRYVHLIEDYVEVLDGKVTVCRDAVKGKCIRPLCKYFHLPLTTSTSSIFNALL